MRPDRRGAGSRSLGCDVTFREFEGRHEMPVEITNDGLQWTAAR